ncbi:hypothetical protein FHX44_111543 [Pseudonocardia hierapolitana]|uniref:Uncharacterized protein n=1 Tax=Pseudonocardia hierapolitana TaxID=1128676 RepID=A0A561SLC9_9PSEU|nr:hypothetical protein [Pseudonocardia hierapolitana]TWF75659.1 hypothetical protein FHX44_111543 [Pseudonocardia hierapolitana]
MTRLERATGRGRKPPLQGMAGWVASLPAAEKDAVLLTLPRGDDLHLRAGLLRRTTGLT